MEQTAWKFKKGPFQHVMAGFQPANCSFLSICETASWVMRHFEEDCPLKLVDVRPGRADHMGTGSFARNGTNRLEKKGRFNMSDTHLGCGTLIFLDSDV